MAPGGAMVIGVRPTVFILIESHHAQKRLSCAKMPFLRVTVPNWRMPGILTVDQLRESLARYSIIYASMSRPVTS